MPATSRCNALTGLAVSGGKVVSAKMVSFASLVSSGLDINHSAASSTIKWERLFCRVEALSTPGANAEIKTEIWLPIDGDWNGKFFGTSSSGIEKIVYAELAGGLTRGYATASMEFGGYPFDGPNNIYRFGLDHPELVKNYAYRGLHVMTVVAKKVVTTFYNKRPAASIFGGWSGAGYQAIGEANRYPDDYDGLVIGSPSINYANLGLSQGYRYVVSHRTAASGIPSVVLPKIAAEVLAQCDGADGLVDGLIEDPRRCQANFSRLICKIAETKGCLNPDQVATLEAIYAGLRDPRSGKVIYPGFPPGAELSSGAEVRISGTGNGSFINDNTPGPLIWALGPNFAADKWMTLDFGADGDRYRAALLPYENSNPDFGAFAARGGKVIFYTGWGESNLNPVDLVNFFVAMEDKAGGASKARSFSRLFMAPGVYHGGTGPGPNAFGQRLSVAGTGPDNDLIMAMDRWVATGVAPNQIIATKFEGDKPAGRIVRTRPLCAFPKVARWNGRGTIDDAAQFQCVDP